MPRREPIGGDIFARFLGLAMIFLGLVITVSILRDPGFSRDHAAAYLAYKSSYFLPRYLVFLGSVLLFVGAIFLVVGRRFDEFLPKYAWSTHTKKHWVTTGIGIALCSVATLFFGWKLEWPGGRPPPPRVEIDLRAFEPPKFPDMMIPPDFGNPPGRGTDDRMPRDRPKPAPRN